MIVTFQQLKNEFERILLARGVSKQKAEACATMFAQTTESGVYSHGINRFPRFIQQLEAGDIKPEAEPKKILSLGAIELSNIVEKCTTLGTIFKAIRFTTCFNNIAVVY
ncbi:Ldh family oxidoreductase [Orbus mooreae]